MSDKLAGKPSPIDGEVEQRMLDEALEETFPASDPVALVQPGRRNFECAASRRTSAEAAANRSHAPAKPAT